MPASSSSSSSLSGRLKSPATPLFAGGTPVLALPSPGTCTNHDFHQVPRAMRQPRFLRPSEPRSLSTEYSMPLTLAKSRSSWIWCEREAAPACVSALEPEPKETFSVLCASDETPSSASSEYVMPLTCSTRRP
jgi:hypothetical protein